MGIPSIFICKEDGNYLIEEYERQSGPIVVELAWNIPTKSIVTVDQWMSSASTESLKFLKEFAPKRRVLNQVLRYQPHFTIFSMGSGGSAETTSKLCTDSTGRYCAEDPDGNGPVSGKEVIEEDLRQLCLHERTKVRGRGSEFQDHAMPPEFAAAYWSYIEKFADSCPLDGDSKTGKAYGTECSYARRILMAAAPSAARR